MEENKEISIGLMRQRLSNFMNGKYRTKKIQWSDASVYAVYRLIQMKGISQHIPYTVEELDSLRKQFKERYPSKSWVTTSSIKSNISRVQYQVQSQRRQREFLEKLRKQQEREEKRKKQGGGGIYGIYMNKQGESPVLVYVGKTFTSFTQRFNQHKRAFEEGNQQHVYQKMREFKNKGYSFCLVPLVAIEKLDTDYGNEFSDIDLKKMELAIITAMKPLWNVQGVSAPYFFKEANARKYFKK